MAITIVTQPPDIHPAYNPAEFVISTDSTAPAFRFYIEIQDIDDNLLTSPLRLPKEPNANTCRLDVSPFISTYVKNVLTEGSVEDLPNGTIEYQIKIGEESIYLWEYDDYEFNSDTGNPWNAYTNLRSITDDHTFEIGDQIAVIQADGGALKPQLTGLFTVVDVPTSKTITLNLPFSVVGSGIAIAGIVSYADNRKVIVKDLAEEAKTAYNGVFSSNYFRREVDGTEFTGVTRKIATNLKDGFRVMPDFNMWINGLLFDQNPTYVKVTTNDGADLQHEFVKDEEAIQFYVGSDTTKYDTVTNAPPVITPATTSVSFEYGSIGGTLSEIITLGVYKGCPVDLVELIYCDHFGSYIPFYFRQVNEDKDESIKEILTDRHGEDIVIGAKGKRSWMLRSDVLNDVELDLFPILLNSPDVRMKIDGFYERVIVTTTTAQRARNSVQKRKDIDVRLAMKDEINA